MKKKKINNILNNKRFFITGNSGFVGSYLSLALNQFGAKVLGYSLKKKNKNYLSNFKEYKKKIKTINDDISNIYNYKNIIKKFSPHTVIHLAAQPIVQESYKSPVKTFETNIMGTVKLLNLVKDLKSVKHILVFTSDKVYVDFGNIKIKEDFKIGGTDPYSASKSSQDIISNSYKISFFKKNKHLTIIRAGNIIGGGDWEYSRLIPDLFNCIYKRKKIILRNPGAVRPWQHVLDVVGGIVLIIIKKIKSFDNKALIYNIGPNSNSNLTVLKLIKKIKNRSRNLKIFYKIKRINFKETKILRLSNKLFKKEIKWKQKININKSIDLTSMWYYNFFKNRKNIFNFTEKQIKNYFN